MTTALTSKNTCIQLQTANNVDTAAKNKPIRGTSSNSDDELNICDSLKNSISSAEREPRGPNMSKAIIEMQRYLEDDVLTRESDPVEW